jgi:hypothetical protein
VFNAYPTIEYGNVTHPATEDLGALILLKILLKNFTGQGGMLLETITC